MNDDYGTPFDLFSQLHKKFKFDLDPCTTKDNPLGVENFLTKEDDGLKWSWGGRVFMNPPYSKVEPWVKKAFLSSLNTDTLVVGLLRHDTSTRWWNYYVKNKAWIEPIPYRLHFRGGDGAYNFPSVIVIWDGLWRDYCDCH